MKVILKPHKEKFLRRGYPWVFRNQIARIDGDPQSGDVVAIEDSAGHTYGLGFYHDTSQIVVRFLTSDVHVSVDEEFFRNRIATAIGLRQSVFGESTHYRAIYGESDGLPGTIVDRYQDVLTWSSLCYGMERRREVLLDILEELLGPAAIVERNDNELRQKDDLESSKGILRGHVPDQILLDEAGVQFQIDVLNGPKTGFFIDQRLNRLLVRRFAKARRVLDVFCADGGFGLHAVAAGASSVHAIDSSEAAMDRLRRNASLNGTADRFDFNVADALDRLGDLADSGEKYDMVILDPPAFAKSRRHRDAAEKAYQRININALKLLSSGGILVTSSCSQAIDEEHFWKVVRYAVRKTRSHVRILARGHQPPDHPVLDVMPETRYLKLYVLQKLADELP